MNNQPEFNKPLISIVITCYNYEKYVEQAIESALGQTYDNIELIIINDGSTDGSKNIINKYISKARVINRENKGIVYTRNEALKLAKGKYLCFLDADDYWDENYIEEMYKLAIINNADVVYPNWRMMWHDKNGKYLNTTKPNWEEFDLEKYQLQQMHVSSESLIKKSAIGKHKFYWKKVAEDWEFFTRLALEGNKFVFAKNCFINYRIKLNSRGTVSNEIDNIREFVKILINHQKKYKNAIEPYELVIAKFDEKNQHARNLETQNVTYKKHARAMAKELRQIKSTKSWKLVGFINKYLRRK